MSRIERAIEKAAELRKGRGTNVYREKTVVEQDNEATPKSISSTGSKSGTISMITDNPYLVTMSAPDSPVAEEYRNLKSMIVQQTRQNEFRNMLMITSSLSNEGKSLNALNLAITLSEELDHTVLLVDADLRNPILHSHFNIDSQPGLSNCLSEGLDIGKVIIRTDNGKLALIPAGDRVENPAELLSSKKMRNLIHEVKSRYSDRYIIIDTPPVLPFAETRTISTLVDGVVFIVKEGAATLQSIQDAVNILGVKKIFGIVYNAVGIENMNGRYSYYTKYNLYTENKQRKT